MPLALLDLISLSFLSIVTLHDEGITLDDLLQLLQLGPPIVRYSHLALGKGTIPFGVSLLGGVMLIKFY
jgi:hypothetical protein